MIWYNDTLILHFVESLELSSAKENTIDHSGKNLIL